MGSFRTLAGAHEIETKVVGSRFIAWAAPVQSEDEARAALEERARLYFDATHNCVAWRLRGGVWRAIDAGEPTGSAGASILAAIDREECTDLIVVVTRYFGGTKLGVGGLARAYADAAGRVLEAAPKRLGREGIRLAIAYPYERTGEVMRSIDRVRPTSIEHGFAEDSAQAIVVIPVEDVDALTERLREETGGSVVPAAIAKVVFYQAEAAGSGLARE